VFGVLGWLMIKFDIPRPPLVLALVLAQLLETSIRQSLLLSFGSLEIFVERPIAAFLLVLVAGSVLLPVVGALRRRFGGN
jgi:putative tricarboxylic transport membrane protein